MSTSVRYKGSSKSGGILHWFLQRWTGVVLIVLLFVHFFITHFSGHSHMTYELVMERLSNPAWKLFDLAFLYFAAYHGIMGALSVVSDYTINTKLKMAVYSMAILIFSYIVIFGTITILSIQPVGS